LLSFYFFFFWGGGDYLPLQEHIRSLEKETAGLRKQLTQEQARTREWKATATGHLHKSRELERMRQVLSHQLRESQQQAEPREQQLAEMQEQIRELDQVSKRESGCECVWERF
jgi:hypothetical protein